MEPHDYNKIITETYNNLRQPFLAFATHKYNLSNYDSEDIFHDTIIAFRQNLVDGKINNLDVPFKTYLFAIGKNKIVDYLKREENNMTFPPDDFPILPEEDDPELTIIKRNETVYREVSQMGNPCKKILLLYYWHDKSMNEIAEQMNYKSPDVAKTNKSRCIKKIAIILTKKLKESKLL